MKRSAGILMYRWTDGMLEVFLAHPGGPYFTKKDAGAWTIPKGEINEGEDPLAAAQREFEEETGCRAKGEFISLVSVKQKGGKIILAWAVEGDCDAGGITSNTFTLEWPPNSRNMREFPEVDRAGWFDLESARQKINPAQKVFLDELKAKVDKK